MSASTDRHGGDPRRGALLALACIMAACQPHGDVRLDLDGPTCDAPIFEHLVGVRVSLDDGDTPLDSGCIPVRAESLEDLQAILGGAVRFDDLGPGDVSVKVSGYDRIDCDAEAPADCTCQPEDLLLCGQATLSLPPPADQDGVTVPTACHLGNGGLEALAPCLPPTP